MDNVTHCRELPSAGSKAAGIITDHTSEKRRKQPPSAKSYEIRVQRLYESVSVRIESPTDAVRYWSETIRQMPWFIPDRETAISILLNTRQRAVGHNLISIGSLNESIVHPRDVFRAAVALNAYGIIVMHNHPSGDPNPSEADRRLTRRLVEAGSILQISMIDHVIVGDPEKEASYFSFKEAGIV